MIDIGVVGCGNWSTKIINEINKNNKFNLTSIVYENRKINTRLKIFSSVDKMIDSNINNSIYVAAQPSLNLHIKF